MSESAPAARHGPGDLRDVRPLVVAAIASSAYAALVAPFYPGSLALLLIFSATAGLYLCVIAVWRPSYFLSILAAFLILGIPVKLIAHLVFGARLVEGLGAFRNTPEQWDLTLVFSTAGLLGVLLASASVIALGNGRSSTDARSTRAYREGLYRMLVALVVAGGAAAYVLNALFNIMKVGYPPLIAFPFPLSLVLPFLISWGVLLAGLSLAWWRVERGGMDASNLVLVAVAVGAPASITMGSRVQMLLYVLAAALAFVSASKYARLSELLTPKLFKTLAIAAGIYVLSLAIVTVVRSLDFMLAPPDEAIVQDVTRPPPPAVSTPAPAVAPKVEARQTADPDTPAEPETPSERIAEPPPRPQNLTIEARLERIFRELRSLVIMRWVGLEGVMNAAGTADRAGLDMLRQLVVDSPDKGMDALYQQIARPPYQEVVYYTFLTLPGPVGLLSFSGSRVVIMLGMFALALCGYAIERLATVVTRNTAAVTVSSVALAYLLVQVHFFGLLLIFALELVLALIAIGLVRTALFPAAMPREAPEVGPRGVTAP